jgi:hypothetical protein
VYEKFIQDNYDDIRQEQKWELEALTSQTDQKANECENLNDNEEKKNENQKHKESSSSTSTVKNRNDIKASENLTGN